MDTKTIRNSTQSLQDAGVVLDAWGNIDVAYYEAKAVEMRSEYLTQLFARWRANLVQGVRGLFTTPVTRNV
ncbi:hypothetical protein N9W78_00820 [bacterium]|nr:hypothetical protein [bacterium]